MPARSTQVPVAVPLDVDWIVTPKPRPALPWGSESQVGAVLEPGISPTVLGILAGLVNRNVVDGNRFAAHVDAVRRDPAVARQVGQAITVQVLQAAPQLIAVRPLVESASTACRPGSVALGPAVRSGARTFHATITDERTGEIDLRLLDVGAAIVGLLPVVAPTAAPAVPADLSVTLTSVKEHGFVAWLLHLSRFAGQLAWLLPLLALLLLVAAVVIAPDRGRGVSSARACYGERRHGGPARHCDRLVRLHRRRANPARGPRGCNLAPTGGPALVGGRIDRARGRRDARRRIRPDLHGRSRRHRRPRLEVHREDPEYKSDPRCAGSHSCCRRNRRDPAARPDRRCPRGGRRDRPRRGRPRGDRCGDGRSPVAVHCDPTAPPAGVGGRMRRRGRVGCLHGRGWLFASRHPGQRGGVESTRRGVGRMQRVRRPVLTPLQRRSLPGHP